jgi:SAM-dependent methyltransferase
MAKGKAPKVEKEAAKKKSSGMSWRVGGVVCALAALGIKKFIDGYGNVLDGFKGDIVMSKFQLQGVMTAFCLSPLPSMLLAGPLKEGKSLKGNEYVGAVGDNDKGMEFSATGDVSEDDYSKDSIYAVLYSIYRQFPTAPSPSGKSYQFTFNTWGISEVPWIRPETEPQRHGMAAYQGLVEFPFVKDYIQDHPNPKFLEIGCGTGAGGNLITQLIPGATYTAVDMQKAAIQTCNELHAVNNPRLECVWVDGGIGNKGSKTKIPDSSVDIVVISETHIADIEIGPEEKAIFADIIRVLKPGGIFVWGNALPTSVWLTGEKYLPKIGFEPCGSLNHTKGAITARDEDEQRVNMYLDHLIAGFPVMKVPFFGDRCSAVSNLLVKNFYRHPGTAMYIKMQTGFDSYMHLCFSKGDKATQQIL